MIKHIRGSQAVVIGNLVVKAGGDVIFVCSGGAGEDVLANIPVHGAVGQREESQEGVNEGTNSHRSADEVTGACCGGWYEIDIRVAETLAKNFELGKEESLVVLNWRPEGAAKLISLESRSALFIKEIAGIQIAVAENFVSAAVNSLVPERVTALMMPPELRPYSAVVLLVTTENS